MTKEYALWLLNQLMIGASVDAKPIIPQYELAQALDLAIKALEQQSTDAKTYLKRRDENYVEYNVEWFLKNWELELEILSGGRIKPTDAVSRQAAKELVVKEFVNPQDGMEEWRNAVNDVVEEILHNIETMPSVTPERPKGKWIKIQSGDEDFPESIVCSRCKNENSHLDFNEHSEPIGKVFVTSKYCPNCGAEMSGGGEDEVGHD